MLTDELVDDKLLFEDLFIITEAFYLFFNVNFFWLFYFLNFNHANINAIVSQRIIAAINAIKTIYVALPLA